LDSTVEELHKKALSKAKITEDLDVILYYSGKILETGKVRDYGLQNGGTIFLFLRDGLVGGNVEI
jgi:hypothetical protein